MSALRVLCVTMSPPTSPLSRARRRAFTRPLSLGKPAVSFFPSARCTEEGVPRQVSRGTQACLSQEQTQSRRRNRATQRSQDIPGPCAISASEEMGRLCQTGYGGPKTCASLSRPLHPSCGHLQSPACKLRRWSGDVPLEGLRPRQQTEADDRNGRGVPAPLSSPCASA